MANEWLKAPLALAYVSDGSDDVAAQRRICERAHSGLIAAKAERIVWGGKGENREHPIGKRFWWAEGHEALTQDWQVGDFSTWIDQTYEVKAYGVSFDFAGLSELVPADKQAEALRKISVLGNGDWISASDLLTAMYANVAPGNATAVLAEACRLGQLGARAMRAVCEQNWRSSKQPLWTAIEWDVPLWFWRDFTGIRKAHFEWSLGRVRGDGIREGGPQRIQLQGVHFHKSGLINLGLAQELEQADSAAEAKRGRKPVYDWPAASMAIWGKIYRGELIPRNQAEIEKALQVYLKRGDKEPSESTVRPYAQPIWDEFSKA